MKKFCAVLFVASYALLLSCFDASSPNGPSGAFQSGSFSFSVDGVPYVLDDTTSELYPSVLYATVDTSRSETDLRIRGSVATSEKYVGVGMDDIIIKGSKPGTYSISNQLRVYLNTTCYVHKVAPQVTLTSVGSVGGAVSGTIGDFDAITTTDTVKISGISFTLKRKK
jgi:hypothetical protein